MSHYTPSSPHWKPTVVLCGMVQDGDSTVLSLNTSHHALQKLRRETRPDTEHLCRWYTYTGGTQIQVEALDRWDTYTGVGPTQVGHQYRCGPNTGGTPIQVWAQHWWETYTGGGPTQAGPHSGGGSTQVENLYR